MCGKRKYPYLHHNWWDKSLENSFSKNFFYLLQNNKLIKEQIKFLKKLFCDWKYSVSEDRNKICITFKAGFH